MVTIQPFEYEKTTAFKERVQIANKVNEIISLFNELDIESKINIFNEEIAIINGKITEINNALNEVNTAVNTVEGYNARLTSVENESISLDARLDNIEPVVSSNTAKIGVLENKDLENVKLSGNQTIENIKTFSNSPIVPNPPSGDTSTKAVNTNWISQTGDSSPNNLVHKIGKETIDGDKLFTRAAIFRGNSQYFSNFWIQNMSIDRSVYDGLRREIQISFRDMTGEQLGALMLVRKTSSTEIVARVNKKDGSYVDVTLATVSETP